MTQGTWNDAAKTPVIHWSVSASLENIERNGKDFAEVTNLGTAVRSWLALDLVHQKAAVLAIEHPIQLDGVATSHFSGQTIMALADHLPSD